MTQSSIGRRKRVQFSFKAEPESEVYLAGTFNDWDPNKLKLRFVNGIHTTSLLLPAGRHEYKFIVNDVWSTDPECPEWTPNGFGSLNSVVVVC